MSNAMLNIFFTTQEVFNINLFLQPALPNTARCAICGEGESDESNPSTHSLMECSVCSQIAHRHCIKVFCLRHSEGYKLKTLPKDCMFFFCRLSVSHGCYYFKSLTIFQEPGEGKINKDLPSCWECPKCYQGKDSASEVTNTHFSPPLALCFSFCSWNLENTSAFSAKFPFSKTSTSRYMVNDDIQIWNDTFSSPTPPTMPSRLSHTSLPAMRKVRSQKARPPCHRPNLHTEKALA